MRKAEQSYQLDLRTGRTLQQIVDEDLFWLSSTLPLQFSLSALPPLPSSRSSSGHLEPTKAW